MIASLYIVKVKDHESARQFIEGEPLNQTGFFESILIRGWTQMQPEIEPGADSGACE